MKIEVKDESEKRLRIVMRPSKIVYVTFAVIFALAGIFVLSLLGDTIRLSIEDDEFHYERKFLGLAARETIVLPVAEIVECEIRLHGRVFPSYDVFIDTAANTSHRIWLPSYDGDRKKELADTLIDLLATPGAEWSASDAPVFLALLLALPCLAGSFIIVFSLQEVLLTGSRDSGILTIHRKRTLIPQGEIDKVSLADYRGIEKKKHTSQTARGQRMVSYQVQIRQAKGKPVPLAKGPLFTDASASRAIEIIQRWVEKA